MLAFLFVTISPVFSEEEAQTTETTEETQTEEATATQPEASDDQLGFTITIKQFEALQKVMLDQAESQNKFNKAFQEWEDGVIKGLDEQASISTEAQTNTEKE